MTHSPALTLARAHIVWLAFGECRSPGWDGPPPSALEAVAAIDAELAASADAGKLAEAVAWLTSGECNVGPRSEKAIATVLAALSRPAPADKQRPGIATGKDAEVYASIAANYWKDAPAVVNESLTTAPVSAQGDERAAFEAHMTKLNVTTSLARFRTSPADYKTPSVQRAWELWQAARAQVAQGDEVDAARASK